MDILITNFRMAERTASEVYAADLARLLSDGFNRIAILAPEKGRLALELESEGRSNYESDSFESIAKASTHASHSSVRDVGDSGSDCDEKKDTKIRAEQPSRNPRGKTKAEKKAAAKVL